LVYFFLFSRVPPPVRIQIKDRWHTAAQNCNRIKTKRPADIELRSPERIAVVTRLLYPEEWQNSALKYRLVDENDITRHGGYVTTIRRICMLKLRTLYHAVYIIFLTTICNASLRMIIIIRTIIFWLSNDVSLKLPPNRIIYVRLFFFLNYILSLLPRQFSLIIIYYQVYFNTFQPYSTE